MPAALETLVVVDRAKGRIAGQVTESLRDAIRSGRVAAGVRLPPSRQLAADLGVSRGVVVEAYEQLMAEGLLTARRGAGTVVAALPGSPGTATLDPATAFRHAPLLLRPGVPDLAAFPRTAWRRAYERALAGVPDADLDYGDPLGAPRLRRELAGYLGRVRSAVVDPAVVAVTSGVAQAAAVLAAALRVAGMTTIAVEDPGSPALRLHLGAHGIRTVPVPVDAEGLDVAALAGTPATAVLVTPAHQFPTGVVLSPARRTALLAWARRVGGLIVEDDYDAEFRYDREPVGCIQGVAPDVTALLGSVSKALAPALRLGWLVVPPRLRVGVASAKRAADVAGPVLDQLALAELIAAGEYDRHLRRARRAYRSRRDAVVRALRRHLPEARVTGVAAGLHLVVELPSSSTVDDQAVAAAARAAGFAPAALSELRVAATGPPGFVVGYAAGSRDQLTAAVARLAALVHPPPRSSA